MYFISAWCAVAGDACFSGGMVDLVGWFVISVWGLCYVFGCLRRCLFWVLAGVLVCECGYVGWVLFLVWVWLL